jgi:hypothetical protein
MDRRTERTVGVVLTEVRPDELDGRMDEMDGLDHSDEHADARSAYHTSLAPRGQI